MMSVDNAQLDVLVSTSSVTLGGGDTSIGHDLYLIDSSVHTCRNVQLVGSSHPVRSEHIESVSCIPIVKWKYSCEVVASFSSSSEDRVSQNVGLGNPSDFFFSQLYKSPCNL